MIPRDKLLSLQRRHDELEDLLCQPDVAANGARFTKLSRERGELSPIVAAFAEYLKVEQQIADDREAMQDPELRDMVLEELPELEARLDQLEESLSFLLLPKDPNDARNTVLEIRSGTGGEEAALFAADLFRMYSRYAERVGWKVELLSSSQAEQGGFKEVVALISGERVYSALRFEGGVHRVQRVPATESQGRLHTSTATVAVLPEADEVDVEIRDEDLEMQATGAGGPGGQHVNTTNSAVQLFHKPSGIMIRCQDERSQHKNRSRAMQILRSRLLQLATDAQHQAESAERRGMVGSGERSEKIRTYNYPQNRVTDHRLGLTLHKLESVMDGDLDDLLTALKSDRQASLLAEQAKR
ncbi:MAG: peptide chain release factor 1 [Myxococcales bacterium]|nr:peptide chain release factor 1 [Myxococcales bacterium]MDD9971422.1 peptide chain release factor 1 [Myxococcales bacterium]